MHFHQADTNSGQHMACVLWYAQVDGLITHVAFQGCVVLDSKFHMCHRSVQQYAGTAALHLQRTPQFATHLASEAGAEPCAAAARASEATAAVWPKARPAFRREVAIAVVRTEFAAAFGIEAAAAVPTPHAAATHAAAKPAATEVLCSRVLCIGDLMSPVKGFISPQSRILDSNGIVAYSSSCPDAWLSDARLSDTLCTAHSVWQTRGASCLSAITAQCRCHDQAIAPCRLVLESILK